MLKIPSIEWLCGHKTPQYCLSSEQGLAVKQRIYCKYKLMSIIIQIKSFLKARICCVSQKKNGCILSFLSFAVSHASQNLGSFTSWILKSTNIMFCFLFFLQLVTQISLYWVQVLKKKPLLKTLFTFATLRSAHKFTKMHKCNQKQLIHIS